VLRKDEFSSPLQHAATRTYHRTKTPTKTETDTKIDDRNQTPSQHQKKHEITPHLSIQYPGFQTHSNCKHGLFATLFMNQSHDIR
jgi:carbohydrate-binding DOMON domain-containing protein